MYPSTEVVIVNTPSDSTGGTRQATAENKSKSIILCFSSFFEQKLDCLTVAEAYMTKNVQKTSGGNL